MEIKNEHITNIQLQISENCPQKEKHILQIYWKLQDLKFVNTPKQIIDKFELTQPILNKLNSAYSTLSFFVYCKNCNSYENNQVKSKTKFIQFTKKAESSKCDYCRQQAKEILNLENELIRNVLIQKLENAIDNQNWKNLSNFEKGVLINSLKMDFRELSKHYGNILGQTQFIIFVRALERIEQQDLLVLHRDSRTNYITNFQYFNTLSDYIDAISFEEEIQESSFESNHETDELKFKLFIDKKQFHPDSPLYAGTITFKERVVIEPGVEYIFGAWQRAKDNLYLTMTPLHNLEKLPVQKRIHEKPISLQKGITDFLNNLRKSK